MRAIAIVIAIVACNPSARRTARRDAAPARTAAPVDAGRPADAAPASSLWGVADFFMANVYEVPDFDARRLGWLRVGARVDLKRKVEGGRFCPDGWYELRDGGFVCAGKGIVVGRMPRSVRLGSAPAKLDELNPYHYGFITRDGTPLYRRRPTREEIVQVDAAWAARVAADAGPADGGVAVEGTDGVTPQAEPTTAAVPATTDASRVVEDEDEDEDEDGDENEDEVGDEDGEEEEEEDETEGGILVRRMDKGNYVAIDRRVGQGGRIFYRTIRGNFVQSNRIILVGPPTYRGFELSPTSPVPALTPVPRPLPGIPESAAPAPPDAGPVASADAAPALDAGVSPPPPALPAGVVYYWRARRFHQSPDGRRIFPRERLDRLTKLFIRAEIPFGDTTYFDSGDGWLAEASQVRKLVARARPRGVGETEKWIDVDISDQTLIAYEGDRPVYATVCTTGLEDEEHATPRGRFRIQAKHVSFTMDDRASDGPYSIEDVPYVMYFQLSYAIHSAFWHGWYGRQRSHGCVNVAPGDARWLFHWVTPNLPANWYGVWSKTEEEGTLLVIRN